MSEEGVAMRKAFEEENMGGGTTSYRHLSSNSKILQAIYQRRELRWALLGMLAVVVLVLMFSVAGKADKSSTKPVMCAGGNGTLRRISREAYEYWSRG
eukprot:173472-Hanusia_phi.AAC.1